MPWKTETVMDQRIEFVLRANVREVSISGLCEEYGVSRPTGYLWLHRYREAGSVTGLAEKSRRPHLSPLKTEERLEEAVVNLRVKYGWGARKIHSLLAPEVKVPTATIHRILVRRGLVTQDGSELKATKRFERRRRSG